MSSYPNRSNLPPVPPPPTLSGQHARPSRHGGGRSRSRSRSRSPDDRRSRRGGGNSSSSGYSKDWDRDRRERGGSRSRRSPSPSYQNRKQKSSEMRPQESAPSAGTSTYKFQESSSSKRAVPAAAAATSERTVNRLPPKPEKEDVVRQIMTPDTVRIPRRETEGLRPIFDRDELREAILRRMKSGDNDENPGTEQRVVAIIREPVMQNMPNHFPLAHQEVIPILPMHMPMQMPMQLQNAQLQVMEERYAASGVTASGVTYSLKQIPEDRDRGRSRSGSRGRSRGDRRGNDGPLESHRSRGRQVSSRSRSRSKERVHRVRVMRGRSGSRSVTPEQIPGQQRSFSNRYRERDLRESLNRHHNAKAEIAPAPDQNHGPGPAACWHCNKVEVGHNYAACGQKKKMAYLEQKYGPEKAAQFLNCRICGKAGHKPFECPEKEEFGVPRYGRGFPRARGFVRGSRGRGVYRGSDFSTRGTGFRNSAVHRGPWKHDMYEHEDAVAEES